MLEFTGLRSAKVSADFAKGLSNAERKEMIAQMVTGLADVVNGKARKRTIGGYEAGQLINELENAAADTRTIRVYSSHGFVANAYKSSAPIRYFYAARENEEWRITAGQTDAKRPHGAGALIVINGRAK